MAQIRKGRLVKNPYKPIGCIASELSFSDVADELAVMKLMNLMET